MCLYPRARVIHLCTIRIYKCARPNVKVMGCGINLINYILDVYMIWFWWASAPVWGSTDCERTLQPVLASAGLMQICHKDAMKI